MSNRNGIFSTQQIIDSKVKHLEEVRQLAGWPKAYQWYKNQEETLIKVNTRLIDDTVLPKSSKRLQSLLCSSIGISYGSKNFHLIHPICHC